MNDFSPEGGSKLSRKERRKIEREDRKKADTQVPNPGRRNFLKNLGIGLGILGVAGAGGLKLLDNEREKNKSFKDRVLEFNWNNIHSSEDLRPFLESGVREYLKVTNSPNLTEAQFLETGRISFYKTTREFEEAIRKLKPNYPGGDTAYSDYDNQKLYFNIEKLKNEAKRFPNGDGVNLTRLMFHELGHFDVQLKTEGDQINKVDEYYFINPNTKKREPYKAYRGVQVYTASSYSGFDQTEEVVPDTLSYRLLVERVGLPEAAVSFHTRDSKYYRVGVDTFLPFSKKQIFLDDLYRLHATSGFDGMINLVGSKLTGPTNFNARNRGRELFIGMQERNPQKIASTGIQSVSR